MKLFKTEIGFLHWCPGCEELHPIAVERPFSNGAIWSVNSNLDQPTFSPSIKHLWGRHAVASCDVEGGICHYFITDGKIQYCSDSTHAYSGKTVELPDIPGDEL